MTLTRLRLGIARLQAGRAEPGGATDPMQGWSCTIELAAEDCNETGQAVIIDGEPTWVGEAICAEHKSLLGAPPADELAEPDTEATAGLSLSWEAAAALSKEAHDLRAEVERLTANNETLVATLNSLRDSHSGLTKLESKAHAAVTKAEGERDALREASAELLEVADLRGDANLPHPEDDAKLWTARMQTAWDELRAALEVPQ